MSGALIVELVAKVGWPLAKELIALWKEPSVSEEQIKRLDAIATKSGEEYFQK